MRQLQEERAALERERAALTAAKGGAPAPQPQPEQQQQKKGGPFGWAFA